MEWRLLLMPDALPQTVAIGGTIVLAVAVFGLGSDRRVNRAFALFLALRAGGMLAATLHGLSNFHGNAEAAAFWSGVQPYFAIAVVPAVIYFGAVYSRRRWWIGTDPRGPWVLLAATLVIELLYLFDHSLWGTFGVSASGRWATLERGPYQASLGLLWLATGFVTWTLARDYVRTPAGPTRESLILIVAGLALNTLYDGVGALTILAFPGTYERTAVYALTAASLLPVGAALVLLARHAAASADARVRRDVRRLLVAAPLPAASIALAVLAPSATNFLVLNGAWRLAFPSLVAYALVRFNLFDVDAQIKRFIENGGIAAFIGIAFFLASELMEALVDADGTVAGLAVAGVIVLMLRPVQQAAERVANRVMPNVEDSPEYHRRRAENVYRATVEDVLRDGQITSRERAVLDRLRNALELTEAETARIEEEARAIGAPEAAPSAAPPAEAA